MTAVLDMAKVTSKGQITIPASIRKAVGVREGDKVLFVQEDNGTISLRSSNLEALRVAQDAFTGAAEEAGIKDLDDMVDLVKSIRTERSTRK
ncbi:regulator [Bifidobacterium lemurum]|uniref:Regulator n=1 Tax=Bifidobacterium lemurum TaxID=1603886 RepID=A0A261FVU4_9BIFI|nr:AbrB/MazE/SpoVT family DNA-binding domain-containing protein [Bifidobacterium lemurum]OZG63307.1 regulator [Bifidobacterium lemurum]